jgi:hypothetical protein
MDAFVVDEQYTSPVRIERVVGCGVPLRDGSARCFEQREPAHLRHQDIVVILVCLVAWVALFLYCTYSTDRHSRAAECQFRKCDNLRDERFESIHVRPCEEP